MLYLCCTITADMGLVSTALILKGSLHVGSNHTTLFFFLLQIISAICPTNYNFKPLCQCECRSTNTCPFGQKWNSHQCKCISNCAGVTCPSNKKCQPVNGECVCIAVQPTSCPSGQRWDENQCRCVITDLCAGEPCPGPNYVCNPATGACLCIAPCGPNQIQNLDCECVGDDGFIN